MNLDQTLLEYARLRSEIGAVSGGQDLAAIRGERCRECTRRVQRALGRVGARMRRALERQIPKPDDYRALVKRKAAIRERVASARVDYFQRRGLSYGWKTEIVLHRRDLDGAVQVDRKELCAVCHALAAKVHGETAAAAMTPKWSGVADRDNTGGVSVYPRRGAAEERLAERADAWREIQELVETAPRWSTEDQWTLCVESAVLSLFVNGRGERIHSDSEIASNLGVPTGRVPELVKRARAGVAGRLANPRWKGDEMDRGGWISVQEAAKRLKLDESTVRKRWVPRWVDEGHARDLSAPGTDRSEWSIDPAVVEAERKRRFGAAS